MVDNAGKFKGWAQVTPLHNKWCDTIRAFPGHVLITVRRKIEYTVSPGGMPKKVGLTIVQRDSLEYELDAMINLEGETAVVAKSRLESPLQQDAVVARADLPKALCALAVSK